MTHLREEYDDPIRALIAGFNKFGFDDDAIHASDRYSEADGSNYETVEEFLEGHFQRLYPNTEPLPDLWEKLPYAGYSLFPAAFRLDWKWPAYKVATLAEWGLEYYGYNTDIEFITEENTTSEYPSIGTTHPEVFQILLQTEDANETVEQVPFRLPPGETERKAVLNHPATAAAMNKTVLRNRGLEIVEIIGFLGDHSKFAVVDRERLDTVEEDVGKGCPVFGKDLVNRELTDMALHGYSPENELSHTEEFGVAEPDRTFKLEN